MIYNSKILFTPKFSPIGLLEAEIRLFLPNFDHIFGPISGTLGPIAKKFIMDNLPIHLVNVNWVMFVTKINVAKVTHQSNIRTLIFLLKKNILGHTGPIATAPSFFSCCYGTSVTKIVVFGWKISVIILLFWVTLATFIFVTNMIHLTFAMRHGRMSDF